ALCRIPAARPAGYPSATRSQEEAVGMARGANILRCALALLVVPGPAMAGCGSSFCLVNTDWASQGEWTEAGGRFDLRYEYIDQNQPRHGAERVGVGEVPEHHDEVRTINRNWIAQFDYNFNSN